MKTLVTALALTTMIAVVGVAKAQEQGSNEAAGYALSQRVAGPSAYASARTRPAYASARTPVIQAPVTGYDFQLQGR
jgi:hypothetical protein